MSSVSPEYRDQLTMEMWYKSIGDDYALWLIDQTKDQEGRDDINEENEGKLYEALWLIEETTERLSDRLDLCDELSEINLLAMSKLINEVMDLCDVEP